MFKNRQEAGQFLAQKLKNFKGEEIIVLGLARGGVVTASEVAKALKASLDILVVKKIGAPGNEELAIGAVGPQKSVFWNEDLCQRLGINEEIKKENLKIKNKEREEKEKLLREDKPLPDLKEKIVILVDDGIATGATVEVAIVWARSQKPKKIILAVPVAPPDSIEELKPLVDELFCLKVEPDFWAVGQFYQEFPQVEDEEVIKLLK